MRGQGLYVLTCGQCEQWQCGTAFGGQGLSQECAVELDRKLMQGGEILLVVLQHELQTHAGRRCGTVKGSRGLVDQFAQITVVQRQDEHIAQGLVIALGEPGDVGCTLPQTISARLRLQQPDLGQFVFWIREGKTRASVGIGAATTLQELTDREDLLRRYRQLDGLQVTAESQKGRQIVGVGINGERQGKAVKGLASATEQRQRITALLLNAEGVGAVTQDTAQRGA